MTVSVQLHAGRADGTTQMGYIQLIPLPVKMSDIFAIFARRAQNLIEKYSLRTSAPSHDGSTGRFGGVTREIVRPPIPLPGADP